MEIVEGRLRPQRAVMYHQGCSSSSSASFVYLWLPLYAIDATC